MNRKYTLLEKVKIIFNILMLGIFTYSSMVFISHFAENKDIENYKYWDSFEAIYTKTNIANEFIIGFGLLIVIVLLFAVSIHYVMKIFSKKNKP